MFAYILCFCFTAAVSGCPIGKEFITAFMTNYQYGKASLTLSITAHNSPATVKIEIKALNYNEKVNIGRGETNGLSSLKTLRLKVTDPSAKPCTSLLLPISQSFHPT